MTLLNGERMELVTTITGQQPVSLANIDPGDTAGIQEADANEKLWELHQELRELHDLMMAAETHGLLIVLQGMDAAGKDVTIENVFSAFNPQAVRVKAFKKPAGEEAKHHFLWRADAATPMYGETVIFDRSYYEQVIQPRIEGGLSEDGMRLREEHITAFERILSESGIILVKVFLHVGKDEQKTRLEERQNDVDMAWKISGSDWSDRERWDDYMRAYEATFTACATQENPWHIVPANNRWFHNLLVAQLLADRLRPFEARWQDARRARGEENQREAEAARRTSET